MPSTLKQLEAVSAAAGMVHRNRRFFRCPDNFEIAHLLPLSAFFRMQKHPRAGKHRNSASSPLLPKKNSMRSSHQNLCCSSLLGLERGDAGARSRRCDVSRNTRCPAAAAGAGIAGMAGRGIGAGGTGSAAGPQQLSWPIRPLQIANMIFS